MRSLVLSMLCLLTVSPLAAQRYFPRMAFSKFQDDDAFRRHWYSKELRALQEPSLYRSKEKPVVESYRFVWLRTFDHPIAIRLDLKADGTSSITIKIANGLAGFQPGILQTSICRALPGDKAQAFLSRVAKVDFWRMPNPPNDRNGEDGSQWIIEGVKRGHYHVVDQWSPREGGARELGLFLAFDLAQLEIPKEKIY